MMHQLLNAAEVNEIINRNPCRYVKYRMKEGEPVLQKDAFSKVEIEKLASVDDSEQHDFAVLACATGMRTQELLVLREDIGEGGATIAVNKAVNMAGNVPMIGLTKSKDSRRKIHVPTCVRSNWRAAA